MFRQTAIEHREIGGDEIRQAEIVFENFVEKQLRFLEHRYFEQMIEIGIQEVTRFRRVDLA